jgi:hypothetical protein
MEQFFDIAARCDQKIMAAEAKKAPSPKRAAVQIIQRPRLDRLTSVSNVRFASLRSTTSPNNELRRYSEKFHKVISILRWNRLFAVRYLEKPGSRERPDRQRRKTPLMGWEFQA